MYSPFSALIFSLLILFIIFVVLLLKLIKKVPEGFVIIRNGIEGYKIGRTHIFTIPLIHKGTLFSTDPTTIMSVCSVLDQAKNPLSITGKIAAAPGCSDEELLMAFSHFPPKNGEDQVVQYFSSLFEEAVKAACAKISRDDILQNLQQLQENISEIMGFDHFGYSIDSLQIAVEEA